MIPLNSIALSCGLQTNILVLGLGLVLVLVQVLVLVLVLGLVLALELGLALALALDIVVCHRYFYYGRRLCYRLLSSCWCWCWCWCFFFLSSLTSLEHLIQHLTREAHEKGVFRLVHAPQSISSNRTFPSLFSLSSTACRTSSMGNVCSAGQWRCSGFSGPR